MLKLLKELLRHWDACSLGLLPCHLELVERLIHLHHLLMKSTHAYYARVQICGHKQNKTTWVNADILYKHMEHTVFYIPVGSVEQI